MLLLRTTLPSLPMLAAKVFAVTFVLVYAVIRLAPAHRLVRWHDPAAAGH